MALMVIYKIFSCSIDVAKKICPKTIAIAMMALEKNIWESQEVSVILIQMCEVSALIELVFHQSHYINLRLPSFNDF